MKSTKNKKSRYRSKNPHLPSYLEEIAAKTKQNRKAIKAIQTLLEYIGEDPKREGLKDTPMRVLRAWKNDWGRGYDPSYKSEQKFSILNGRFKDGSQVKSQMITVKKIRFTSHCEHHMAPFSGTIDIAYIPAEGGPILGLSKLVRIVELYSKRLQVQERLTDEIADFINDNLKPIGVGVICRATHGCMISRGVKQFETVAVTSALRGEMLEKADVRDEFYRLVER